MLDRASAWGFAHTFAQGPGLLDKPKWVAPKIAHGTVLDEENMAEVVGAGWLRLQLRNGVRVAPWMQLVPDVPGGEQAVRYLNILRSIELALGLAKGALIGMVNDEVQGNPKVAWDFVRAYRLRAPLRPTIVVPLGLGFLGGDGKWYPADCNLAAWKWANIRDLAECYQGNNVYDNAAHVLAAHSLTFAAPKPLFPAVNYDPPTWLRDYQASKVPHKGLAAFPAERLSPAQVEDLQRGAIARGLL